MIEEIPNPVKHTLNEFIRIGKRYQLQKKNLIKPLSDQLHTLWNHILDVMAAHPSKNFCITINTNDHLFSTLGEGYHRAYLILTDPSEELNNTIGSVYLQDALAGSFSDMFADVRNNFELFVENTLRDDKYNLGCYAKKYLEELDSYIDFLKRIVAMDFFKFKKLWSQWVIYDKKMLLKEKELVALLSNIEYLWNHETLHVGDKIKYWHSQNEQREGTVTRYYTLYTTGDMVEILSPKGRKIQRQLLKCMWNGRFRDTELAKQMSVLMTYDIPEEWSERKLDYYS